MLSLLILVYSVNEFLIFFYGLGPIKILSSRRSLKKSKKIRLQKFRRLEQQ